MEQTLSRFGQLCQYVAEALEGHEMSALYCETFIENSFNRASPYMNLWKLALQITDRLICLHQVEESF